MLGRNRLQPLEAVFKQWIFSKKIQGFFFDL
jgi:hypothetical protein